MTDNDKASVRSVWTPADEAKLLDLQERKNRIMGEARERVSEVVAIVMEHASEVNFMSEAQLVNWAIGNADALTEVLAPFCSAAKEAR